MTLVCALSGDLLKYGFGRWTHEINGQLIKKLVGIIRGNRTSIVINSCTYRDSGEYTCTAWNKNKNDIYWSNKTTSIKVNGRLVI